MKFVLISFAVFALASAQDFGPYGTDVNNNNYQNQNNNGNNRAGKEVQVGVP